MAMINLQQNPVIPANVESLIQFWNAGFAAGRANMTYVVETRMGPRDFISVAQAQIPLIKLIQGELYEFSQLGWKALPDYVSGEGTLSKYDEERLALFRHDVAAAEGLFPTMVSLSERNRDNLIKWYREAQYIYRKRLSLREMIRGLCYGFHTNASRKRISLEPRASIDSYLRIPYFDPAKTIFNNILSNAIKYGRDGGSVKIWDDGYSIYFRDNGHGMSPDFAAKLGQGERLREGRIKDVRGEGLGWKSIGDTTRKLGWRWEITTGIGEGTTVRIDMLSEHFVRPRLQTVDIKELMKLPKRDTVDLFMAGAKIFRNALPFEGYLPNGHKAISVANSPIYASIENARALTSRF